MHLQATRPDTLGVALTDSPAGLAAWILEKFYAWSDKRDGQLLTQFDRDDLLTNVMLYWVSGSITTSVRLYREALQSAGAVHDNMARSTRGGVAVPAAIMCSPVNTLGIECLPRAWAGAIFHDLVHYTDLRKVRWRARRPRYALGAHADPAEARRPWAGGRCWMPRAATLPHSRRRHRPRLCATCVPLPTRSLRGPVAVVPSVYSCDLVCIPSPRCPPHRAQVAQTSDRRQDPPAPRHTST